MHITGTVTLADVRVSDNYHLGTGEILKARERDLRIKERKRKLVPLASVKVHV